MAMASGCGSINFDAQAMHDEAEEEFEREDRERQNELKDLLTSEFDDNLDDSDINDDEEEEYDDDDDKLIPKGDSMAPENNAQVQYVNTTNNNQWPYKDNYLQYTPTLHENKFNGVVDPSNQSENVYESKINSDQSGNVNYNQITEPSYDFNNNYQEYPNAGEGYESGEDENEGDDTVVNDNNVYHDDNNYHQGGGRNVVDNYSEYKEILKSQKLQDNYNNNESFKNDLVVDTNGLKGNMDYYNNNTDHQNHMNYNFNSNNYNHNIPYNNNKEYTENNNKIINPKLISEEECMTRLDGLREEKDRMMDELRAEMERLREEKDRGIDAIMKEMERLKGEMVSEMRISKHKYNLLEEEKELIEGQLGESRSSQEEAETARKLLQGQMESMAHQLHVCQQQTDDLAQRLVTSESLVEDLKAQLVAVSSTEVLVRMRNIHERASEALKQQHQQELDSLRRKNEGLNNLLAEKEDELVRTQEKVDEVITGIEVREISRGESINKLTKSLHQSQQQCNELLDAGANQEVVRVKVQLQEALVNKKMADEVIVSLKTEIRELKEQLSLSQSSVLLDKLNNNNKNNESNNINKNNVVNTRLSFGNPNDSYKQLNINKSPTSFTKSTSSLPNNVNAINPRDFITKDTSNTKVNDGGSEESLKESQTIGSLKGELERLLELLKNKRLQENEWKSELSRKQKEVDETKEKLDEVSRQVKKGRNEMVTDLQKSLNVSCDGGCLTSVQLNTTVKDLQRTNQELNQSENNLKTQLDEVLERVRQAETQVGLQGETMSRMVQEHDEDKKEALYKCKEELMTHHERTCDLMKHDLRKQHEQQVNKLKRDLEHSETRCSEAERLYIECCRSKGDLENEVKVKWQKQLDETIKELSMQRDVQIDEMLGRFEENKQKEVQTMLSHKINQLKFDWMAENNRQFNDNRECLGKEIKEKYIKEMDDLREEVKKWRGQIDDKDGALSSLNTILVEKEEVVMRVNKNLVDKEVVVGSLQTELEELKLEMLKIGSCGDKGLRDKKGSDRCVNEVCDNGNNIVGNSDMSVKENVGGKGLKNEDGRQNGTNEEVKMLCSEVERRDKLIGCLEKDLIALKIKIELNKKEMRDSARNIEERLKKEYQKEMLQRVEETNNEFKNENERKEEEVKNRLLTLEENLKEKHTTQLIETEDRHKEVLEEELHQLEQAWKLRMERVVVEMEAKKLATKETVVMCRRCCSANGGGDGNVMKADEGDFNIDNEARGNHESIVGLNGGDNVGVGRNRLSKAGGSGDSCRKKDSLSSKKHLTTPPHREKAGLVNRGVDVLKVEIDNWKKKAEDNGFLVREYKLESTGLMAKISELSTENEKLKGDNSEMVGRLEGEKKKWLEMKAIEKERDEVKDKLKMADESVIKLCRRLGDTEDGCVKIRKVSELEGKLRKAEKLFRSMQAKFQSHLSAVEMEKETEVARIREGFEKRVGGLEKEKILLEEKINVLITQVVELRNSLLASENDKDRIAKDMKEARKEHCRSIEQMKVFYERSAGEVRKEVLASVSNEGEKIERRVSRERHKTAKFMRKYYMTTLKKLLCQHQHTLGSQFICTLLTSVETSLDNSNDDTTSVPTEATSILKQDDKLPLSVDSLKLFDAHHCHLEIPKIPKFTYSHLVSSSQSLHHLSPNNPSIHPHFNPPPLTLQNKRHHLIMQSFADINKLCLQSNQSSALPSSKAHHKYPLHSSRSDYNIDSSRPSSSKHVISDELFNKSRQQHNQPHSQQLNQQQHNQQHLQQNNQQHSKQQKPQHNQQYFQQQKPQYRNQFSPTRRPPQHNKFTIPPTCPSTYSVPSIHPSSSHFDDAEQQNPKRCTQRHTHTLTDPSTLTQTTAIRIPSRVSSDTSDPSFDPFVRRISSSPNNPQEERFDLYDLKHSKRKLLCGEGERNSLNSSISSIHSFENAQHLYSYLNKESSKTSEENRNCEKSASVNTSVGLTYPYDETLQNTDVNIQSHNRKPLRYEKDNKNHTNIYKYLNYRNNDIKSSK